MYSQFKGHPVDDVSTVIECDQVLELQNSVRAVKVEPSIAQYIVGLAEATRQHSSLRLGCSPRGTLAVFRNTQACAFVQGRDYAIPEDVKAIAIPVLAHRLALETKAKYEGTAKEDVVRDVLDRVPVGV